MPKQRGRVATRCRCVESRTDVLFEKGAKCWELGSDLRQQRQAATGGDPGWHLGGRGLCKPAPRWECWRRRPAAPRAAATRAPRGAMSLVASCACASCSTCSTCCSAALKVLQCSACSNGRFPHFVPRDRTPISPVIARQTRRPFALFPFRIPSPRRARRAAGLMSTSLLSSAVR